MPDQTPESINNKDFVMTAGDKVVANSDNFGSVHRHSSGKVFASEVITDIHTRHPFSRHDYNYFRPSEATPTRFKEVIKSSRSAYKYIGVVRNVVDMMTDFVCEGLKMEHVDPEAQALISVWMKKVGMQEATNEFAKHLIRDGNAVVQTVTGKLTKPVLRQWQEKIEASPDLKIRVTKKDLEKQEIAIKYNFLNILSLDWEKTPLSEFTNSKKLVMTLPSRVTDGKITEEVKQNLPSVIREAVKNGKKTFPLDMSKIHVSHNKKDSWEKWASPYLECILDDINFRNKLRQAELSALDGVINVIRIWKLGDHTQEIIPGQAAFNKLLNMLEANTGGGSFDLVWDSMIEMDEHYPPIKDILSSDKYDQVNRDILIGLGIPEVLIGGKGANFSNSWIQLKTLVEKLEYVRTKLMTWIEEQVRAFCKTMGIETMPRVRFKQMNLHDENSTKKLVLQLLDRGIVSVQSVLEAFGEDIFIEESRKAREENIEVMGPYSSDEDPNPPGRPDGEKDGEKRTKKKEQVRTADLLNHGFKWYDIIDEHVTSHYLKSNNISNARKLSKQDVSNIDTTKLVLMSCLKIDTRDVQELLDDLDSGVYSKSILKDIKENIANERKENEKLTCQIKRNATVAGWLSQNLKENNNAQV